MNKLQTVIGIEIHLELNTKTKMFSSAPNNVLAPPNTNVNLFDLAYPGILPVVNKKAIIKAIKMAKSLNMKINNYVSFDRKNYFYPDLPKGFQITQFYNPIASEGIIKVNNQNIKIKKLQIEEDACKSIYKDQKIFLDYNRAGIPLIEIITEPIFSDYETVIEYVKQIQKYAIFLNISNAKMELGSLRVDLNVSLKKSNNQKLGTKVEIKNLNSFANIKKAIELEVAIQKEYILSNKKIEQLTKKFDENIQKLVVMRLKVDNYKYFYEPNIPTIYLENEFIENIKLPELPNKRFARYVENNILPDIAHQLIQNKKIGDFFDSIIYKDKNKLSKIFFSQIMSVANSLNKQIYELDLEPQKISTLLDKLDKEKISLKNFKKVITFLIKTNQSVDEIIQSQDLEQISNEEQILIILNKIIKKNIEFIYKNKNKKEKILKFILGLAMKESHGKINPILTSQLLNKKIKKNEI